MQTRGRCCASSSLVEGCFADSCHLAHLCVEVEVGNNLTQDHDHTILADVLVHNWSEGKPAAFDFLVTSSLNSLILSEARVSPGAAAQASEIRKHNSNDGKCGDLGWVCIPLVVETYDAWGQEAVKSFALLASRLAITCSKPKSVVTHDLYGRLYTPALCDQRHWPSLVGLSPYEVSCVLCTLYYVMYIATCIIVYL